MEVVLPSAQSFQRQIQLMERKTYNSDCCNTSGQGQIADSVPRVRPVDISISMQQKFFLAGFRDCRQEVLRYLVDIEQVPLKGPVIFGLEQYLTKLETVMQTSFKCSDWPSCGYLDQSSDSYSEELKCSADCSGAAPSDDVHNAKDYIHDTNAADPMSTQLILIRTPQNAVVDNVVGLNGENLSFDSGCDTSLVTSSANSSIVTKSDAAMTILSPADESMKDNNNSDDNLHEPVTESELAENALQLMRLAQNNPNISRVLNELFVLMDEDYDDIEEDDDDDEDDGVEMEENDDVNADLLDDC